jgi:hypothetical protein
MMTLDKALLTCPFCREKESILLRETFQPESHTCPYCKITYHKKENHCCVICDFSDLFCLPRQKTGTCSW